MSKRFDKGMIKDIGVGVLIASTIIISIISSSLLSPILETQIATSRANLLVDALLSGMIIAVYLNISSSEEQQSEQISEQVDVMQSQLAAAHNPQIATDFVYIDGSLVTVELSNLGNGSATEIELNPSIDVGGDELQIEPIFVETPDGLGDNYLRAGKSKDFVFTVDFSLKVGEEEVIRGEMGEIKKEINNKFGRKTIQWDLKLEYTTVLGETKTVNLPKYSTKT